MRDGHVCSDFLQEFSSYDSKHLVSRQLQLIPIMDCLITWFCCRLHLSAISIAIYFEYHIFCPAIHLIWQCWLAVGPVCSTKTDLCQAKIWEVSIFFHLWIMFQCFHLKDFLYKSLKEHKDNSSLPNLVYSLRRDFVLNTHNKPGSNHLFCTVSFAQW